jgi:hypothetical protein
MRVFIRKYELRMITINEYHFPDRDNTLLYIRKESCDFTKNVRHQVQLYDFISLSVKYHLKLHVFELRTISLYRFCHTEW